MFKLTFFSPNITTQKNLFTITGYEGMDPEMRTAVGYSTMRQYAFGVNITF
ncbi:hypothetical protein [Bacteroides ovatus]|uniref:hypothetical protein n=1 Tax=Bacteroides ovatus TaxID=28116 RepID=UPI00189B01B1|nr:hypothetical protein [Bacteroides ovatus]